MREESNAGYPAAEYVPPGAPRATIKIRVPKMSNIDFISDSAMFMPLWERANASTKALVNIPSADLLYFDAVDISTQKFFDLVRAILPSRAQRILPR